MGMIYIKPEGFGTDWGSSVGLW